jgi:DNA primase
MITQDTIARIVDAARIYEVVSDYLPLRRKSANYTGNCPFHNEKTPSFVVSPVKNIYKCFGCGKAGGPVQFVMEHDKLTYVEALRHLAKRYNIDVVETQQTAEEKIKTQEKESLFIVNEFALEYYEEALHNTEHGRLLAKSYFVERGISEETMRLFHLGYASDVADSLYQKMKLKGYNVELMAKVGLISQNTERPRDFFRERVIYPIHSLSGKVVAFAGRLNKKNDNAPKYLNSPETEIYNKSQTLYGLHLAKQAIAKEDVCLLVEGYMDVISLMQHGIKNVVASSGTSLTVEQVRLIKRYTQNIVILYDGDNAGVKAAQRGLELILEEDMNVKILLFDADDDPDSYVQRNGTAALQNHIETNAQDFIYFKTQLQAEAIKKEPLKKVELLKDIVNSIAKIPDALKRSVYTQQCASLLKIDEAVLLNEINKARKSNVKQRFAPTPLPSIEPDEPENNAENKDDSSTNSAVQLLEKQLIRLMIESGNKTFNDEQSINEAIIEQLTDQGFESESTEYLFAYLKSQNGLITSDLSYYINHEDKKIADLVISLFMDNYELSENWKTFDIFPIKPEENYKEDAKTIIYYFQLRKIESLIKENMNKLKVATDETEIMELQIYINELSNFRKIIASQRSIAVS